MDDLNIVKEYFRVPYGDCFFVYTNRVFVSEIADLTFHDILSHKRAFDGRSIAMAIHEAIKSHHGDLSEKRVLDLGSSIGHFSFLMAEEGATVTGVEWLEERVNVSQAIARLRSLSVKFVNAYMEDYVFDTAERFDIILMHNIFEYIPVKLKTNVLRQISKLAEQIYATVSIDPNFIIQNSEYTQAKQLLSNIYGIRGLWAFWRIKGAEM